MIKPRDYQEKAISAIFNAWQTRRDVLVTMATGTGKTMVFLSVLDRALLGNDSRNPCRGLAIAHRQELIDQPLARLESYYPHWRGNAGIVMGDIHQPDKKLVISTIQSLSVSKKRLQDILKFGKIDYLVIDEAHHATDKNSYAEVIKILKEVNPELRHLGVTATPIRADGDGMSGVYETEAFHYGIKEGIRDGNLVPIRWLAIQTRISLDGVTSVGGDFNQGKLAKVYETKNCFDLVVETHKKFAGERQAIAFTVTVEGAKDLAEAFNLAGIKAEAIDASTDKSVRKQALDNFNAGKTMVLCNVGIYTEGVDLPSASCIHQVRPTRSDGLYVQMIGRALRLYPGKEDALILDYAPLEKRNVAMAGDILGVPLRKESYIKPDAEEGEAAGGFLFDGNDFQYPAGNPADIISRQLDYLDLSPWSWYRRDGWMSLGLGEAPDGFERVLMISPPEEGKMSLYGLKRSKEERFAAWTVINYGAGSWDQVEPITLQLADKYGNPTIASKGRRWKKEPPTDKMIKFAKRIKGAYDSGMNRGELAKSITHQLARREIETGSVVLCPVIK